MLEGTINSLVTVALCHRLRGLRQDWQAWQDAWYRLPEARPAATTQPGTGGGELGDRIRIDIVAQRHVLHLTNTPESEADKHNRFFAGAASQTFRTLLSSLNQEHPALQWLHQRRILLCVAREGVGKGHFFSTIRHFETPDAGAQGRGRLVEFLERLNPHTNVDYSASFYSFSFSTEITSVFDKIIDAIWKYTYCNWIVDCAAPDALRAIDRNWESIRFDRLGRLRYALQQLTDRSGLGQERRSPRVSRMLIALNSINIMFFKNGLAKNRQFREFFTILLDDRYSRTPIDLLLICGDDAIPVFFKTPTRPASLAPITTKADDQSTRQHLLLQDDTSARAQRGGPHRSDSLAA